VVGYFCTGSELKSSGAGLRDGQKVSSNSLLLAGILASYGATLTDFGIAADTFADLSAVFAGTAEWAGDVVVSTGGMGPGKYDLVEKAFLAAGGLVFFTGLAMRPGKRMLFGQLGEKLFFALPGPPHAVRTLLHTLVGPALLSMQGVEDAGPRKTRASLLHLLDIKNPDILQLKDGVLEIAGGLCRVRLADRLETSNCHILLPPGRSRYEEGELIEVHVVGEPLISP
jgi:molybdopterin molybdotransferase